MPTNAAGHDAALHTAPSHLGHGLTTGPESVLEIVLPYGLSPVRSETGYSVPCLPDDDKPVSAGLP